MINQNFLLNSENVITPFKTETAQSISFDKNGNLLMYTAGCNISDRLHKPMPNGKINEGFVWDFACTRGDYVIHNGSLFLPNSLNDSTYFIIHKFVEFDPDSALPGATATKLLYSTVDMTLNNGSSNNSKTPFRWRSHCYTT